MKFLKSFGLCFLAVACLRAASSSVPPFYITNPSAGQLLTFNSTDKAWENTAPATSGTVTSFSSGNLSPLFTTSVATATSTPALSFSLSTHVANTVFAGPATGADAAPTFRALVAADLPSGAFVSTLAGTANQITASAATGAVTLSIPSTFVAPGTVTSTGLLTGSAGAAITGALTAGTVNGNTITTGTGVLTLSAGKTLAAVHSMTLTGTDGTALSLAGNLTTSGAFDSTFTMTGNTAVTFPTSGTLATTTGYVSDHQTANSSGNSTVTPTTQLHTEEITLSGSSGARGIVVGTAGIVAGARADLIFTIPATAGIVVTVYSGSLVGAVVQTFTTTGAAAVTSARLTCNYTNSQWNALYYQGPIP